MPYNSETETFYQAAATVVDSTPDGDTVQEGFDDRLTPAMAGLYADLNLLKADGMISVGIPATTTARGIGRVATQADMIPGAEVAHGPAFLDATSVKITAIPTASTIPQANAKGKLATGWIPGLFSGDIRLLPFSPGDLATYCPGWYFCNGDRYALTSEAGSRLNALPASFKTAWGITISGSNISVPNLFYSDGRGYYLRAVNGTTKVVGSVELDAMRELSGSFAPGLGGFEGGEFTGVFRQGSQYNIYAANYRTGPVASRTLFSVSAAGIPTADEFRTIYRGMTPAIFLGD
jgi:hypothetical protein